MPISDLEIWRSANVLVQSRGDEALIFAIQRAAELDEAGGREGAETFRRIASAIGELQSVTPGPGQRRH